ncbi:MAG: PAS domain S-box protein [Nitrospinota bacterium]|nr:PAS domain S-box protein [Nitrospinota bacterium]
MSASDKKKGKKPAAPRSRPKKTAKRQEEESLSKTFSQSLSGGWEWDLQTDQMAWSDRFFEIIGHSPKSLAPSLNSFLRIVHPADRSRVKTAMDRALDKKGQIRVQFRVVASDSLEKNVRMRGEILSGPDGANERLVGLIQEMTEQMTASETRRQSEQRLAFHVKHTPLGVIEWDLDFNVVEWNPAAEKIFGFSQEEAKGKNAMDLIIPPSAVKHVEKVWAELLRNKGGERSNNENITRDGRTIICQWYNTPLLDMDGEVTGVASLVQDVTEQENARAVIQESEERYRLLVELSPVAIAAHCGGKLIYVNPACMTMFREPDPAKFIGKDVLDFVAPECREMVTERIRTMLSENKRVPRLEQVYVRSDGARITVETVAAPFTYQGKPAVMVAFEDVTERKKADRELKRAKDFLQNLMDAMPNPVYHKDVYGLFTGCNKAFENLLGKTAGQIVGKSVYDLSPKELADKYSAMDQELFRNGGIQSYESRVALANGGYKNVIFYKACFHEPDGRLAGLVGVILDITDQKNAQSLIMEAKEAAERASRAKSTFLSSISHEVRTPLNSIIGFASLLASDNASKFTETQRDFISRIKSSGEHLLELFDEILELSRIESGKMTLPQREVDLCEVALSAMATASDLAKTNGIRMVGPDLLNGCHVLGDFSRLTQVLVNLLTNGIKYNKRGGEVALSFKNDGSDVRITVADNGLGVPPDKVDMLFEPFDRLGAEGLNIKGTGIGLTVVKKLVGMMGGRVEVETALGAGSKFHVIMPRIEKSSPAPSQPTGQAAPQAAAARSSILVVEDNADNLELMRFLLEKHTDYEILTAAQAPEALEIARSKGPKLILMDIGLPGIDGYEALKLLKSFRETRDIPVFAVSSRALPQEIRQGLEAGFTRYITKPILANLFLRDIREAIEGQSANTQT